MKRTLCAVGLGALSLTWVAPVRAVTITFERLGVVDQGNTSMSWSVNDNNQDLVAYDCSTGTCTLGCYGQTFNQVAPPTTICEVQGFHAGETVTVSAASADCYSCPGSCTTSRSECPAQPAQGSSCTDLVRFSTFTLGGKGQYAGGTACTTSFSVQNSDLIIGACWQCGPNFLDPGPPVQYVGTSCTCQPQPPPVLSTPTTTTIQPPGTPGEPLLLQFMDNLVDGFLPPALQNGLRRLVLESSGMAPDRGLLRGQATASISPSLQPQTTRPAASRTVVVFKGKKRIHKPGAVTLRLKLTRTGKRLLGHTPSRSIPLTVTVTFSGPGTTVTRSTTITLSH
jgi:hypothetical protein